MGCGKTTLGEPLARCLGKRFIDLDAYIEEKCDMTAKQIFIIYGEPRFREIEREALQEIAKSADDAVVACGGGTPLQPGNMEMMNRLGITVWLQTSVDRITSRLVLPEQRAKRPLLNNMNDDEIREQVITGLKERSHYYEQAQLRFDSTNLESIEEIETSAQRLAAILLTANEQ